MTDPASSTQAESPLSVGAFFAGTFRAWSRGLARSSAISLLFYAPLIAMGWLALRGSGGSPTIAASIWGLVRLLLLMAVSNLVSAAVVFGAVQDRRGAPASIGRCIGVASSAFWPILGMSILVALLAFLCALPFWLTFTIVMMTRIFRHMSSGPRGVPPEFQSPHAIFHSDLGTWMIATGIASVLAGAVMQARFLVAPASILVERRGVSGSMGESSRLTRGHRTVLWFVVGFLSLCGASVGFALQWFVDDASISEALSLAFAAVIGTPLMACASAVAYEEMKRRKDGVDVATLGRIFD